MYSYFHLDRRYWQDISASPEDEEVFELRKRMLAQKLE